MQIFTVSGLNDYISALINNDFLLNYIKVEGEICDLKIYSNEYMYFSIKDELSKIKCVMFSYDEKYKNFTNGMKVILEGNVSLYIKNGVYQINVKKMEEKGLGALYRQFLDLKKSLEDKNFFDKEHKKNIPPYPKKIGIVTSLEGAAINDILTILRRRAPILDVYIYHSAVQGKEAELNIIEGIKYFNENINPDLILLSRGGGSYEDLFVFNSEKIAESIYDSKIPIISAIGHENDVFISDYVADLRAATPSEAAEIISKNLYELKETIRDEKYRLYDIIEYIIKENYKNIEMLHLNIERFNIKDNIQKMNSSSVLYKYRINSVIKDKIYLLETYLEYLHLKINNLTPYSKIKNINLKLEKIYSNIKYLSNKLFINYSKILKDKENSINCLDINAIFERGFSLLYDIDNRRIDLNYSFNTNEIFIIKTKNSNIKVKVLEVKDNE